MSDFSELNRALEGKYRIERELGEGGMASVYLAEDIKHARKVAMKVLKPELAAVIGGERFLAEIRTTANLQHPHILPLFDSGEAGSFLYYVMPYVEGETLRDRLDRDRQLPVEEALSIARDVADALDYAHRNDVIHRDIKPENILLHEGNPVVADFGIALAISAAGGGRMTETGLSLGTPHYMSPEQATAERDLSVRSDVYSLACVLYEMLAGDPPHTGPSAQAVLMRILTEEPRPILDLRRSVPPNVSAALQRALEKLPADRFESAEAFRAAIDDRSYTWVSTAVTRAAPHPTPAPAEPSGRGFHAVRVAPWGLVAILVGLLFWTNRTVPTPLAPPVRAALYSATPGGGLGRLVDISPDGTKIAVVQVDVGQTQIYLRRADDPELRPIPGTEGGINPSFSPDGDWIAFTRAGTIFKVSLAGGPALQLTAGSGSNDVHWGWDDYMYTASGLIYRVPSTGGDVETLYEGAEAPAARPFPLPDGKAVVFSTVGGALVSSIWILELETGEARRIIEAGNDPRYLPTGHLVYGTSDGALLAQAFDLESHQVVGGPVPVIPALDVYGSGAVQFAVSQNGTAVYSTGALGGGTVELLRVSLDGEETPYLLPPGGLGTPRYSPGDGERIAYQEGSNIWVYDVATGAKTQLTFNGTNVYPFWSRDGSELHYSADNAESESFDGFRKPADGSGEAEIVIGRPGADFPQDVSQDGQIVVFRANTGDQGRNLLLWHTGSDSISPYLTADWNELMPTISPDGRWLAYVSDETQQNEVYVRTFPDPAGGRWRVSSGGGDQPLWSPDGGSLYYTSSGEVRVADVQTEGGFSVGPSRALFTGDYVRGQMLERGWDIHPDGNSFVVMKSVEGLERPEGQAVYIVTNWFTELLDRMGERN
jgi:serine/threonine-protein kinase